jgi:hypothetical protein
MPNVVSAEGESFYATLICGVTADRASYCIRMCTLRRMPTKSAGCIRRSAASRKATRRGRNCAEHLMIAETKMLRVYADWLCDIQARSTSDSCRRTTGSLSAWRPVTSDRGHAPEMISTCH